MLRLKKNVLMEYSVFLMEEILVRKNVLSIGISGAGLTF